MLKQNPTTGIYLLLHQLLTEGFLPFEVQLSSEDIMDWHAFGVQIKPTASVKLLIVLVDYPEVPSKPTPGSLFH